MPVPLDMAHFRALLLKELAPCSRRWQDASSATAELDQSSTNPPLPPIFQ